MKSAIFVSAIILSMIALIPKSYAITCANGVYREGCAGPNGAVVARKPIPTPPVAPVHRGEVNCASGPYRAGCAGPNGAAVVRRPY
jgi:hypothetical protein